MTFSILHTSARPEQWKQVYDAWIAAADHPEYIEYVLCVDERWGFSADTPGLMDWSWRKDDFTPGFRAMNKLVWNTQRRCYVDGVNTAAAASTADVFIVNADDQYPCPHWDTVLRAHFEFSSEFQEAMASGNSSAVVWANTLTPRERERRIMPMPILTRAYYEQKGYVFYPKYESMYADNDFCEQALYDGVNGDCAVLYLADSAAFPHRHPYFDPKVSDDAVYQAQNRREAYNTGAALFAVRKANGFTDVSDTPATSDVATTIRRRIAICISGEWFPAAWVVAWTELLQLTQFHDILVTFGTSSNVHVTRIELSKQALAIKPDVDYILWIDDDNIVTPQQILQLITDLEHVPHASFIAGWTETGAPVFHSDERKLSCGRFMPDGNTVPMSPDGLLSGDEDLKEIDYTGFPVVLMRRSLLEELGAAAFAPLSNPHHKYGFHSEDVSFCTRARNEGHRLFVDRRVLVPHLKLRDITTFVQAQAPDTVSRPTPDLPRLNRDDLTSLRDHSRRNVDHLANAAV